MAIGIAGFVGHVAAWGRVSGRAGRDQPASSSRRRLARGPNRAARLTQDVYACTIDGGWRSNIHSFPELMKSR